MLHSNTLYNRLARLCLMCMTCVQLHVQVGCCAACQILCRSLPACCYLLPSHSPTLAYPGPLPDVSWLPPAPSIALSGTASS